MSHRRSPSPRHLPLLAASLITLAVPLAARADDPPPFEPLPEGLEPSAYLEFGVELDNRCMLLSPGGKLVWMRNRHPSMAVRFRLIRMYADVPQAGRVVGVLPPGPTGTQLGCNLVTGREQRWEVERAGLEAWTAPEPQPEGSGASAATSPPSPP